MATSAPKIFTQEDRKRLRNWKRRGTYSETALAKLLYKKGFKVVRIPMSAPSKGNKIFTPLPDVIARRGLHTYAFEVKKARYYLTFEKHQIEKLYRFLDEIIAMPPGFKHPVLAAHFGKKWVLKRLDWCDQYKLPDSIKINKRQHTDELDDK